MADLKPGDPPLRQVVAHTIELGVRGDAARARASWRAGVFRTDNVDDILFVSSDASGQGYFRNFGRTRRQGIELGATGSLQDCHARKRHSPFSSRHAARKLKTLSVVFSAVTARI